MRVIQRDSELAVGAVYGRMRAVCRRVAGRRPRPLGADNAYPQRQHQRHAGAVSFHCRGVVVPHNVADCSSEHRHERAPVDLTPCCYRAETRR